LALIPVALLVSLVTFSLITLLPGDPAVVLAGGFNATPERVEEIRHSLGLDQPFLVQFSNWWWKIAHGDLGQSIFYRDSVASEIATRLPVTISLGLSAILVGLLIGVPAGILGGTRPGTAADRAAMFGATVGMSIPNFWLAMILISLFAIKWKIFPAVGFVPITEDPIGWLRSVALPATALSVFTAALVGRQLRTALMDVMQTSYVRTAWAKGGTPAVVVIKHAMKNAAIPTVTVLGLQLGAILGGTVIIEQLFSIPGVGQLFVQSILVKDIPVVQGVTLVLAAGYITVNLLVDIVYGLLNPKVRVT
jgi:peptide/nickel transport system permease protein